MSNMCVSHCLVQSHRKHSQLDDWMNQRAPQRSLTLMKLQKIEALNVGHTQNFWPRKQSIKSTPIYSSHKYHMETLCLHEGQHSPQDKAFVSRKNTCKSQKCPGPKPPDLTASALHAPLSILFANTIVVTCQLFPECTMCPEPDLNCQFPEQHAWHTSNV